MLVAGHEQGLAFALQNLHGQQLGIEKAPRVRGAGPLLAAQRKPVLVLTGDLVVGGDILAGLRHGVGAVAALQERIDESPAERGVENLRAATESRVRLGNDERSPRHRLHAARHHYLRFARLQRARGYGHCIETRSAEAVDRGRGHRHGKAREQRGHAGHVAVVLAGLICAP